MTDVLMKRGNLDSDTHRENNTWRLGFCCHEPKNSDDCWRERLRTGSPSQLGRNQPCWHLDFRLLASRAVREWISVVSATPLGVPCYSSPSRLTQVKDRWQHSWVQWEKVRRTFTFYPTHLYSNSYFSKNVYWWAASDLSFSILDLLWHTGSFLPCTGFL